MSDMSAEALKTRLRAWYQHYHQTEGILEQDMKAYTQLRKLIEESEQQKDSEAKGVDEDELRKILIATMEIYQDTDGWQEALNYGVERIKQHLQQHPLLVPGEVDEELRVWLRGLECDLREAGVLYPDDDKCIKRIKQFLPQPPKRTVTREWVKNEMMSTDSKWIDRVVWILKELGIKVVNNDQANLRE